MKRISWYLLFLISFISNVTLGQLSEQYTGLTTTASGLQYKVTQQGKGDYPQPGDKVWLHFVGKLPNDSIFESTLNSGPIDVFMGEGQLIKGWEEGLQLVKPEGSIVLIVPPELAYGDMELPNIPKGSTLTFEISLLQIDKGKPYLPYDITGKKVKKGKKKLKYIVVEEGTGPFAQKGDNAYLTYTGMLEDGTIFDSSKKYEKPVRITVGINQVIEGWDMGLTFMQKGTKIRLIVPPELAYGKDGYKNIVPANATLSFDMELVDLVPPDSVEKWDISGKQVMETASGLKYVVFEEGEGELIQDQDVVEVHYSGYFTNGELFDSSVKRFEPIRFPIGVNAVIDGWEEGLKLMKKGSKFQLIVPSNLAYGEEGAPPQIPANTDLIFDIEVLDVIK